MGVSAKPGQGATAARRQNTAPLPPVAHRALVNLLVLSGTVCIRLLIFQGQTELCDGVGQRGRTPSRTVVWPSQTVTGGWAGDIRLCCLGFLPNCLIAECAGFLPRPANHPATKQGHELPFSGTGDPRSMAEQLSDERTGLAIPRVNVWTAYVTRRLSLFLLQTGWTSGAARQHQVRPGRPAGLTGSLEAFPRLKDTRTGQSRPSTALSRA